MLQEQAILFRWIFCQPYNYWTRTADTKISASTPLFQGNVLPPPVMSLWRIRIIFMSKLIFYIDGKPFMTNLNRTNFFVKYKIPNWFLQIMVHKDMGIPTGMSWAQWFRLAVMRGVPPCLVSEVWPCPAGRRPGAGTAGTGPTRAGGTATIVTISTIDDYFWNYSSDQCLKFKTAFGVIVLFIKCFDNNQVLQFFGLRNTACAIFVLETKCFLSHF